MMRAGDCLGLCLNLNEGFIVFLLNGVPVCATPVVTGQQRNIDEMHRFPQTCGFQHVPRGPDVHWHASLSLMAAQECRVNFGGEPFRYGRRGWPMERSMMPINNMLGVHCTFIIMTSLVAASAMAAPRKGTGSSMTMAS
jgi:hypothetical protein